jgi:hypothetical protein
LEAGTKQLVPVAKPPDGVDHHYAPLAIANTIEAGELPQLTP